MKKKEKRFAGKTTEEMREMMKAVRKGKSYKECEAEVDEMIGESLKSLNSISDEDNEPEKEIEMEVYLIPNHGKKKPKKK